MQVIETEKIPYSLVTRKNRPGRVQRKLVREGEVSPGVGFTADLVRYEGGQGVFTAPRHQHNFDQIRYVISGRPDFGNGQVAEGVKAASVIMEFAEKYGLNMPIAREVDGVINHGATPEGAYRGLAAEKPGHEVHGAGF